MITDPVEYLELQELTSRYLYLVDNAEWDTLADVFVEEGCFDMSDTWPGQEPRRGIESIRELFSTIEHPIAHNSFNLVVSAGSNADERVLRSKMLAVLRNGKVVVGEYQDVAVRTDRGWRLLVRRAIRPNVLRAR